MKIHVIYKVCDKVDSVHGLPRPFNMTKRQVIDVCVKSLSQALSTLSSVNIDYYVSVVGDSVTESCIKNICDTLKPVHVYNPSQQVGYREIMVKAAERAATTSKEDWVYFVEDDYLHAPGLFGPRVADFFNLVFNKQKFALPCFMHPSDYPDQYTRLLSRCYLFQGHNGYWREVTGSTETYLCPASYYNSKIEFFKNCYITDGQNGVGSDYKLSSLFRKEILCFSPLPGMATHMHLGVMSDYINWKEIINSLN